MFLFYVKMWFCRLLRLLEFCWYIFCLTEILDFNFVYIFKWLFYKENFCQFFAEHSGNPYQIRSVGVFYYEKHDPENISFATLNVVELLIFKINSNCFFLQKADIRYCIYLRSIRLKLRGGAWRKSFKVLKNLADVLL